LDVWHVIDWIIV